MWEVSDHPWALALFDASILFDSLFPWPRAASAEWNDSLNHPHVFEEDLGKLAASNEYKNAHS